MPSLTTVDGALRVEFHWLEDRFEHVLFLHGQKVATFASIATALVGTD